MSLPILLAATDISALSRFTAQRAAMLAEQIGAKLEFVHALDKESLMNFSDCWAKMVKY